MAGRKKNDKSASSNPLKLTEAEEKAYKILNMAESKTLHEQFKRRDFQLSQNVKSLQNQDKKMNFENLLETKKKEEEIDEQLDENVLLNEQINSQGNEFKNQIQRHDDERDREFRQLNQERQKEVGDLKRKIESLLADQKHLLAFPQREKEYLETIAQLEQDQINSRKIHSEELKKQEEKFKKQKKKIEEDQKEDIQKIRSDALEEANKKILDAQQTAKESMKLHADLELHQNELEQLRNERDTISNQNNAYKRSLQQNHEGLTEYQTVNHKQQVKYKKLKEKVKFLKDFLEKENKKFEEETESLQKVHQLSVAEMEYELKCLNEQVRRRTKEIREIKSISQMILDQRSDIEQFFLESLDIVKEEQMVAKLTNDTAGASLDTYMQSSLSGSQNKLPALSRSHKHSLVYKNKIDVNELDDDEKERILKLVFQKMNSGMAPKPWRQFYDGFEGNDGYNYSAGDVQEEVEQENIQNDDPSQYDDQHLANDQINEFDHAHLNPNR